MATESTQSLSIEYEEKTVVIATQPTASISIAVDKNNAIDVQSKQQLSVSVINPNKYIHTGGTEWGEISGTVSNQTDLVSYITSVLPDVPYETAQDIVNALNSFGNDGFTLSTVPQFSRGIEIGVDENNNSVYSLPSGGLESELPEITDKFGYFLLTDPEGNLYWKNFPLDFLAGLDEEAAVDGGTF